MRMKTGVLIDTNLLLVMIMGGVDEGRYISKSKRLGDFCIDDYHMLWELVKGYREIWIKNRGQTPFSPPEGGYRCRVRR